MQYAISEEIFSEIFVFLGKKTMKRCFITEKQNQYLQENFVMEKKLKKKNYLYKISFKTIPLEELKQAYIDLSLYDLPDGYGSTLSKIAEGLSFSDAKRTADADITINDIIRKFGINRRWQIQKVDASNQIFIIVAYGNIGNNRQILIDALKNAGYFLSFESTANVRGMQWGKLQFEPMFEEDKTDDIRKCGTAWHWSPSYNEENILKNGFVPKTENRLFLYPPRVYFIKGGANITEITDLGKRLCSINSDIRNNGEYTLYLIDTTELPSECRFYYDPNMRNAMYTENIIPTDLILKYKRYNLKNL